MRDSGSKYGLLIIACEIWGDTFEMRFLKVVVLQKKAIRLVDNVNY